MHTAPMEIKNSIEHFSGSIKTAEILEASGEAVTPVGLLLRPIHSWQTQIVVGQRIKLVLPDGTCHFSKVRGGEIMTNETPAMLIEFVPEINSSIPEGTRVFILSD